MDRRKENGEVIWETENPFDDPPEDAPTESE